MPAIAAIWWINSKRKTVRAALRENEAGAEAADAATGDKAEGDKAGVAKAMELTEEKPASPPQADEKPAPAPQDV